MVKQEKSGKGRDFSLDAIRLPAMILVLVFHLNVTYQEAGTGQYLLLHAGRNVTLGVLGTMLFILLSGYTSVLSFQKHADDPKKGVLSYYGKRLLSIFPAFYFSYLIFFIMYRLQGHVYDRRLVYTALGLDGYLSAHGVQTWYLVGEWYIGCILILYLVFPLVYYGCRKLPALMIAIAAVLKAGAFMLIFRGILPEADVLFFAPEFIAGVLFCMYRREFSHMEVLIAAALFLLSMLLPVPDKFKILMDTPAGLGGFVLLKYAGGLLGKSEKRIASAGRTFISTCAKYSFAAFLVHHQIIEAVFRGTDFIGSAKRYPVYIAGSVLFTALLAVGVYGASEHVTGIIRKRFEKT